MSKSKSNHTVDLSQTALIYIKTAFEAFKTASASAKQCKAIETSPIPLYHNSATELPPLMEF